MTTHTTIKLASVTLAAAAILGLTACQPTTTGTGHHTRGEAAITTTRSWPYATVWVEDHTGDQWPVTTAVRQWDTGTGISVRYGACRPHAGCVRVYESNRGDNGEAGFTRIRWNAAGALTSARVRLNTYYAGFAATVACHELGHALGLRHSHSRGSCLYPMADEGAPRPDAHDRAELNTAWRRAMAHTRR